jgi:hypothetical protein
MSDYGFASLPKQTRYWAEKHGFTLNGYGPRNWRKGIWACHKKTDRRIRINTVSGFQICDGYFDRWANSVGATMPVPH